jgi:hypothetical protein
MLVLKERKGDVYEKECTLSPNLRSRHWLKRNLIERRIWLMREHSWLGSFQLLRERFGSIDYVRLVNKVDCLVEDAKYIGLDSLQKYAV